MKRDYSVLAFHEQYHGKVCNLILTRYDRLRYASVTTLYESVAFLYLQNHILPFITISPHKNTTHKMH